MNLGRYLLTQPIGRGGMGVVWAAHLDGEAEVAIKLLTSSRARDRRFRDSLRREARTIARLDHPSIVGLHDIGTVSRAESREELPAGAPYLVMDLVRGVSLHKHRGQLRWGRVREVLLALLGALAHAHSRGVIHGDLKPSNVMVDQAGVRLTDFGVARMAGPGGWGPDERPTGGTPSYMAPELLSGDWRDVGPWTDLFGLGCLAWSLVCGRPPHHVGNRYEVMRAQLQDPLPRFSPVRAVAPGFEAWLRRLLAKDPGHRFRRGADAAWALLALAAEVPGDEGSVEVSAERPRTTVFWTDIELRATPGRAERTRGVPPQTAPAPIPSSWRSLPDLGSIARRLAGTGLGLLGIRPAPLIGRDEQRDVLWQALRVAAGGVARAVVLSGPAGTGQGRLARWLVERAHEAGAAEVLVSHGADGAGSVIQAFERALVADGLERDRLGARLDLLAPDMPLDDRQRLVALLRPGLILSLLRFESADARRALSARWMRWLARGRVLVWWVDEAERASEALQLCLHLLQRRPELPIVIVLSTRDDAIEARPDGQTLLAKVLAHEAVTHCPVGPMADHQLQQLVHEVLGLAEPVAHELVARAGGNPRYALTVMREAADRGHLVSTSGGYRLAEGAELRLPRGQRAAWSASLARALQGLASRQTAELGAVLGARVALDEWIELARRQGLPSPEGVADSLVRARLLQGEGEGYRFVHAMVHETVLDEAKAEGRLALHHRACAELLQSRGAGPARVGRHLIGAGQLTAGVQALLEGAELAMTNGSFSEVRTLLRERDDALVQSGEVAESPERVRGWVLLAQALEEQGHPQQADEVLRRVPEGSGLAVLRGRVALALGRLDEAHGHFQRGLAGAPAAARLGLASLAFERGDGEAALEHATQAAVHAVDQGDALAAARAVSRQGLCLIGVGRPSEALERLQEALDRFDELGHRSGKAYALRQIGLARQLLGQHRLASEAYAEAMALFEEGGDLLGARHVHNGLGDLAREGGDLEAAERHYRRAIAGGQQAGGREGALIPSLNLALVLLEQERFDAAHEVIEPTTTLLVEQGRRGVLGVVHIIRATMAAKRGDHVIARARLEEGESLLEATGRLEPDAAVWAERLADALSDPVVAQRARDLAVRQWERMGRDDEVQRLRSRR